METPLHLDEMDTNGEHDKEELIRGIVERIEAEGYSVAELNTEKPWGGYIRIDNEQADTFIQEFFPGITPTEARLGEDIEVSPKLLIVSAKQRLSWQYHHRRAEKWTFLTPGAYHRSETDEQGEIVEASAGDVVQFDKGERHRLVSTENGFTVVAEIWQHTDPDNMSDENDIVRLQDDYDRAP